MPSSLGSSRGQTAPKSNLLIGLAGLALGVLLHRFGSRKRTPPQTQRDEPFLSREAEAGNENALRLLTDSIPALVWRTSPTGMNEYANRQLLEFSGGSLEGYSGEGWQALIHPDDLPPTMKIWQKALERGTPYRAIFRFRRADGVYRWFDVRGEPFRDETGEVTAWYGVLFDIDDRKCAEDALRLTRARLSRAAQAATVAELSASIAHEINQPLAAILANGQACLSWLQRAPSNVDRALLTTERLIRDVKAAAELVQKIRGLFQRADPQKKKLDLNEAIREILSLTGDDLAKRGISIQVDVGTHPLMASADRTQIQQVLTNMISNAADAMSEDSVHEKILTIRSRKDEDGTVLIQVVDTGKGTPDPESMFEPFFTTKRAGMGMGLVVSRAIVSSHGGKLWATQNSEAGLTVSFSLPPELESSDQVGEQVGASAVHSRSDGPEAL